MNTKGIFVSYRRDETAGYAGRLADRLNEHFGEHKVFRDIDSIDPGLDFVEAIQRAVDSSEVLIAVIGRNWLSTTDTAGRERLQDPHDYVRMEIVTALERNIRVIPVLVQGASMPATHELPDDLAPLTRRNAFELHDSSWSDDIRRLVTALERVVGNGDDKGSPSERGSGEGPATGDQDTRDLPPPPVTPPDTRVAPRARWRQIVLAVLLAGTITIVPQRLWFLLTDNLIPDVFVYMILHPITLFCGLWASLAWPGRHPQGYLLLGSCAGLIDLTILGQIISSWSLVRPVDLLSDVGIAVLFTAGGRFGDLFEGWRYPHASAGESELTRKIADKVSGPAREPNETTTRFVQALGPIALVLIGIILGFLAA
jgi:hypothetical protein